jgi:hypothetical protein
VDVKPRARLLVYRTVDRLLTWEVISAVVNWSLVAGVLFAMALTLYGCSGG